MAVAVAEPEAIWKPTLEELQSRPVVIEVNHLDWSFGARQVLYDISMQVHEGEIMVIMGGLLVATLLTLFFLPALYALWYRVPRGTAAAEDEGTEVAEPRLMAAE